MSKIIAKPALVIPVQPELGHPEPVLGILVPVLENPVWLNPDYC